MLKGIKVTKLVHSCDVTRGDGRVFRIEIHQHESDADIYIVEHELKVFRLSYPAGFMRTEVKGADPKFRQFWMYLEDFPKVSTEGRADEIRDRAMAEISRLN